MKNEMCGDSCFLHGSEDSSVRFSSNERRLLPDDPACPEVPHDFTLPTDKLNYSWRQCRKSSKSSSASRSSSMIDVQVRAHNPLREKFKKSHNSSGSLFVNAVRVSGLLAARLPR